MLREKFDAVRIFEEVKTSLSEHFKSNNLNLDEIIGKSEETSLGYLNKGNEYLFERLIKSIHNANWKAGSQMTFWQRHEENYRKAFHDYDAEYVSRLQLDDLKDRGLIKSDKKLMCCINAAKFIVKISKDSPQGARTFFNKYVDDNATVYDRWALVCLISESIKGMGTALSCDFLKEIGYLNFGKPDIHLKRIFDRMGLSEKFKDFFVYSSDDFFIFQIIDYIANAVGQSLFVVDKYFWIFATGFNEEGVPLGGICKSEPSCNKCEVKYCGCRRIY